jgi:hypothetical protein
MHLLIPYASALDEACAPALQTLNLPHLACLLGRLQSLQSLGGDEFAALTPHELALARAWGWQDGEHAFAAAQAEDDGIATESLAWALLTPLHLSVTSDQVTALHPELLALDEAESRAFFAALAPLFPAEEGWRTVWAAPTRWYVAHDSLAGLTSASLERVVNRNVDPWMPEPRLLRRLQNEMQMLLHREPLNAARETRGAHELNSVWISGCGRARPRRRDAAPQIDERLREPLLAGDWAAWREAWQALDAGPVKALLECQRASEPVRLTLAGERRAQRFAPASAGSALGRLWQRLAAPRVDVPAVLEAL